MRCLILLLLLPSRRGGLHNSCRKYLGYYEERTKRRKRRPATCRGIITRYCHRSPLMAHDIPPFGHLAVLTEDAVEFSSRQANVFDSAVLAWPARRRAHCARSADSATATTSSSTWESDHYERQELPSSRDGYGCMRFAVICTIWFVLMYNSVQGHIGVIEYLRSMAQNALRVRVTCLHARSTSRIPTEQLSPPTSPLTASHLQP